MTFLNNQVKFEFKTRCFKVLLQMKIKNDNILNLLNDTEIMKTNLLLNTNY